MASSLLILMVAVFFIGSEQKIFSKKNEYVVRLESASGLAEGNPVKLSGVTIGAVKDINLPRNPAQKYVEITLMVQRKFENRIRDDSRVRLKKLGLLAGDSYIEITPGSPNQPALEPGSIILSQKQTSVDALISSGEGLVDNFVQISYSLKNILTRVDKGQGLLGELTTQPEGKKRLTDVLLTTLTQTNDLLRHVQSGQGVLGKLIYDDAYGTQLTTSLNTSVQSLQSILGNVQHSLETNSGVLPALLNDAKGREKVISLIDNLQVTSENLSTFSKGLKTGDGLVPRLVNDKVYADQTLKEFTGLVTQLNQTATKLNGAEGTAGKLIADPAVYESINDILIGINQSKLLRWLIRSRQEKGIEQRYKTEQDKNSPPKPEPKPEPKPGPSSVISPPATEKPPAVPAPAAAPVPAPPAVDPGPPPSSTTPPTGTGPQTSR